MAARAALVVELRYFAGLEVEEVATVLSISPRTAASDWRFAKAWLHRALAN
jgi:DNA-directed RNA polymerase specialized sigma24 family protein